jgi:hypothetical protein
LADASCHYRDRAEKGSRKYSALLRAFIENLQEGIINEKESIFADACIAWFCR